ncbi:MAG: hypothetical protein JNN28_21575 [Saprospiraceae bacterium]|nr:hypothetical protein [Saprospiraceae bacterium]
MKNNIFFALLSFGILSFSCDIKSHENIENDGIIGTWKEIVPKAPIYSSSGVVIDSIDASAIYEFHQDSTFNATNDYWTGLTHGTWEFDTSNYRIFLYPIDDNFPTFYRKDIWGIIYMDEVSLNVGHQYDHLFPGDSSAGAIYLMRNFKRI